MKIAIDFDGTCVTHDYPNIGDNIGAVEVLKELVDNGHDLILYTMRSGAELDYAVQWFAHNKIRLYGIQYDPNQTSWTSSNKCYANLYIDDAALGVPLIYPRDKRPHVDWEGVKKLLIERKFLT